MFRWVGWGVLALGLTTVFVGLASVYHVRSAIAGGALEYPALSCVAKRDLEKVRSVLDDNSARSLLRYAVYAYHVDDNHSPGLGWRGALAELGIRLSMSGDERIKLASAKMNELPVCRENSTR